jgi:hypothetical protein
MGYNGHGHRSQIAHCIVCDRPFRQRHAEVKRGGGYYCSYACFVRVQRGVFRALRTNQFPELLELIRRLA